jgi:hypothetical protein
MLYRVPCQCRFSIGVTAPRYDARTHQSKRTTNQEAGARHRRVVAWVYEMAEKDSLRRSPKTDQQKVNRDIEISGGIPSVDVSNVLNEEKKKQVIALGQLGCSLRQIEKATGIRRETAGGYLKAAGIGLRSPGDWRKEAPSTPANGVTTEAKGKTPSSRMLKKSLQAVTGQNRNASQCLEKTCEEKTLNKARCLAMFRQRSVSPVTIRCVRSG